MCQRLLSAVHRSGGGEGGGGGGEKVGGEVGGNGGEEGGTGGSRHTKAAYLDSSSLSKLQSTSGAFSKGSSVCSWRTNSLLDVCSRRRVVVLQLDICKWTELSSCMQPLALAKLVHTLFCDFDKALSLTEMFKVDNMGDSYLCCGWLPDLASFQHGYLRRERKREEGRESERARKRETQTRPHTFWMTRTSYHHSILIYTPALFSHTHVCQLK